MISLCAILILEGSLEDAIVLIDSLLLVFVSREG